MPGPITITDNGYCEKDSDESLIYTFDYDTLNLAPGVELVDFGLFILSGAGLIQDSQALIAGNRHTRVRLSGGTIGTKYTVSNRVQTNESPNQIKEKRFYLRIKH